MDHPYTNITNKKDYYGDGQIDAGSIPSLVGNLSDGVLMLDSNSTIMFVNESFCRLLGYNEKDLTGLSFKKAARVLFDELSFSWVRTKLQKVIKGQKQFFRHNWRNSEGTFVPVEIEIHPTYNGSDEIVGALMVIKDSHAKLLLDIVNTVNSNVELDELLSNTSQIVVERLGLSCSGTFLLSDDKRELQMASCNILNKNYFKKYTVSVRQGVLGRIATKGSAAYLSSLDDELAGTGFEWQCIENVSIIGFPLTCKGKNLGVMIFGANKSRHFTEIEMDLFQSLASQVAMAVYNAKLSRQVEYMAATDGLTGLFNHKYFKKRLKEEVKKARGEYSVSLLMIDIDNFKVYNDHFGHPAGDILLERMAKMLRTSMRSQDVVARYGGEEFTIILVNCEPMTALNVAERIRQAMERYRFSGREVMPGGKVTVSIGISTFPVVARNAKNLLELSDKALSQAKSRKNCIVMADK